MRHADTSRTLTLPIAEIRADGGTQPRSSLSPAVVDRYATAMADGVVFPPVVAFFDGQIYWLADGFHRIAALKKLSKTEVDVIVHDGTLNDARWFSYGANAEHGQTRSRDDEVRAVKMALRHPHSRQLSDREIARHVGVSHPTIAKYRAELVAGGEEMPEVRTGKDGRQIRMNKRGADSPRLRQAASPLVRVRRIWDQATDEERHVIAQWVESQELVMQDA